MQDGQKGKPNKKNEKNSTTILKNKYKRLFHLRIIYFYVCQQNKNIKFLSF